MRIATVLVACGLVAVARAAPVSLDLATADGQRHALVVTAGSGPRPTVLVLHGRLGTAASTLRSTGFAEAAARHGFTAVFPDGIDRQWHDGRFDSREAPDDIGYLRALVARLVADGIARSDAVYITGISNGGIMSLTMMCRASDLFAGVGTVIASLPRGLASCDPRPVPAVFINGTADPIVPYRGGRVGFGGKRGAVDSIDATIDLFARADRCDEALPAEPVPKKDPTAPTTAFRIAWRGCMPGTSVTAYRIDGGGHALPGRPSFGDRLGPANQDVDAAEAIIGVFAGST